MRGLIADIANPHPLGATLPSVYQEEDEFTMRLTEAFDDALAPVVATLDNLSAYFDPRLAPEDFLSWLAGWVAVELDETWDMARRRQAVLKAVDLLRRRGTAVGLADEVGIVVDGEVEIVENGGSGWSIDPGSPMVGSATPSLVVRIRIADPGRVDVERIEGIVRAAKPAHVPHRIEIVATGPAPSATKRAAKRPPRAAVSESAEPAEAAETDGAGDSGTGDDDV
jgi:phage tail-like protein